MGYIDICTVKLLYLRRIGNLCLTRLNQDRKNYEDTDEKLKEVQQKCSNNNVEIKELIKQKDASAKRVSWLLEIQKIVNEFTITDNNKSKEIKLETTDLNNQEYLITCFEYDILLEICHKCRLISNDCSTFVTKPFFKPFITQINTILSKPYRSTHPLAFKSVSDSPVYNFQKFIEESSIEQTTIDELDKLFDNLKKNDTNNFVNENVYEFVAKHIKPRAKKHNSVKNLSKQDTSEKDVCIF